MNITEHTNPAPAAQDYPHMAAECVLQQAEDESREQGCMQSIDLGAGKFIEVGYCSETTFTYQAWDFERFSRSTSGNLRSPWIAMTRQQAIDLLASVVEEGCK